MWYSEDPYKDLFHGVANSGTLLYPDLNYRHSLLPYQNMTPPGYEEQPEADKYITTVNCANIWTFTLSPGQLHTHVELQTSQGAG